MDPFGGLSMRNSAQTVFLILFGASWDLVWRKLGPALFDLHADGWLP